MISPSNFKIGKDFIVIDEDDSLLFYRCSDIGRRTIVGYSLIQNNGEIVFNEIQFQKKNIYLLNYTLTDTIADLCWAIKAINRKHHINVNNKTHCLVKLVQYLADKYLIEDGNIIYGNIAILEEDDINVFPVEKDRFGWLIGGIQTNKGIITFG
jgi:hypothetical protein